MGYDFITVIKMVICRFCGHRPGKTWEHQGSNTICRRCNVVYKSGGSYYALRSFNDAVRCCGISESIYRDGHMTKYAKNHPIPLPQRVPLLDRLSRDWCIYNHKEA